MDFQNMLALLQTVSIIVGIWLAVGTIKKRGEDDVKNLADMQADVKYIKKQVEGMCGIPDRLTRVEETAKNTRDRLNEHLLKAH